MLCIIAIVVIIVVLLLLLSTDKKREFYRDPIYLNRAKLSYDWYPRANGSIYGWPIRYGGSWNLFSGFPYYNKAY